VPIIYKAVKQYYTQGRVNKPVRWWYNWCTILL